MTFVGTKLSVVTDRLCDFDDDGLLDNAVADLGGTMADIYAATISSAFQGFIVERGERYMFHFPYVEDRAGPDLSEGILISVWGVDANGDPSDDFSGEGGFAPSPDTLDGCHEPLYVFESVQIHGGRLSAEGGVLPVVTIAPGRGARAMGVVAPGGRSISGEICAYFEVREMGSGASFPNAPDLSPLEVFLSGGAGFGVPTVAGLTPDVDLDGDGLERLELDGDNHVIRCIDGDGTVIEGTTCWEDSRIADAVSVTLHFEAVPAELVGLEHEGRPESCETGESSWGICPWPELRECEPGETRPCPVDGCAGALQKCLHQCSGWGPCWWRSTRGLTSCEEVDLFGAASCAGAPSTAMLVSGADQTGGIRTADDVAVGRGGISITGRVSAAVAGALLPGNGFAVSASVAPELDWTSTNGWHAGINYSVPGYTLRWMYHFGEREEGNETDYVQLIDLLGGGPISWTDTVYPSSSTLDAATVGEVSQGLRLHILPDLPETPENEMLVRGYASTDRGVEGVIVHCSGATCPHRILPGDVIGVGVTASSFGSDISVRAAGADLPGFEVEVLDACP